MLRPAEVLGVLAAYYQYWRINILTFLEYRANFIMWFGFTIVYHATAIAALFVTMRQFPTMNTWDIKEMFFLYAMWMAGHELHNAFFFNVVSVPEYVRAGQFDRFLVRPLDALFQVLTVPSQQFPDGLILATATFCVATAYAGVKINWIFIVVILTDGERLNTFIYFFQL